MHCAHSRVDISDSLFYVHVRSCHDYVRNKADNCSNDRKFVILYLGVVFVFVPHTLAHRTLVLDLRALKSIAFSANGFRQAKVFVSLAGVI